MVRGPCRAAGDSVARGSWGAGAPGGWSQAGTAAPATDACVRDPSTHRNTKASPQHRDRNYDNNNQYKQHSRLLGRQAPSMNRRSAEPSPSYVTEQINLASTDLDRRSTADILRIINDEDKTVPAAVEREIPRIATAADAIHAALAAGGRLFYVGAGTSGRLGIIDAAECPPTFGTDPELVQGIISGGEPAVFRAREGAEDDPEQAGRDLLARALSPRDVVVGLSASGRTPYVLGALEAAKRVGAVTIAVSCNPGSPLSQRADISIEPVVGPEVVTGSTRMKAATAEKLVLNMLSTTVMVKLGRVSSNLMVDLRTGSAKLVRRAKRIISLTTGVSDSDAAKALEAAGGHVKAAIVMTGLGVDLPEAQRLLDAANGRLTDALEAAKRSP